MFTYVAPVRAWHSATPKSNHNPRTTRNIPFCEAAWACRVEERLRHLVGHSVPSGASEWNQHSSIRPRAPTPTNESMCPTMRSEPPPLQERRRVWVSGGCGLRPPPPSPLRAPWHLTEAPQFPLVLFLSAVMETVRPSCKQSRGAIISQIESGPLAAETYVSSSLGRPRRQPSIGRTSLGRAPAISQSRLSCKSPYVTMPECNQNIARPSWPNWNTTMIMLALGRRPPQATTIGFCRRGRVVIHPKPILLAPVGNDHGEPAPSQRLGPEPAVRSPRAAGVCEHLRGMPNARKPSIGQQRQTHNEI